MSDRLSGHDQFFLHAGEAQAAAALVLLDPGPGSARLTTDDLHRLLVDRIHLLPRHRQVPIAIPGGDAPPRWVDDPTFRVGEHVFPGGPLSTEAVVEVHERAFPPGRSPWDATVFETGAGAAVFMRWHHSMVDGMSAMAVARVLFDSRPDKVDPPPPPWRPPPIPPLDELMTAAAFDRMATAISRVWEVTLAQLDPATRLEQDVAWFDGWLDMTDHPVKPAPATAGPTRLALSAPVAEPAFRSTVRSLGVGVEAAILTLAARAMSRLAEARGEATGEATRRVLVPVAMPRRDRSIELGNAASFYLADLPLSRSAADTLVELDSQVARIRPLHTRTVEEMLRWLDDLPSWLVGVLSGIVAGSSAVDAIVSYVRGPRRPLWMAGHPHRVTYSSLPATPAVPLSIGVTGLGGSVGFSVSAKTEVVPEVEFLAQAMQASFEELVALV